jgi:TRAP-type C4-dicarboxylate transport system substrate-binding protein
MQMMDLVQAGAVDIGILTSALVSGDRLPLIGLLELPGIEASLCDVADAVSTMAEPGQVIYEQDLAPNGIRILSIWPYPPYGPAASRKEITEIEDPQGMRLRNAGGLMEYSVVALGGVPVRMPSPEVYQSLQRGTIDAVLFSFLSVKSFDLQSSPTMARPDSASERRVTFRSFRGSSPCPPSSRRLCWKRDAGRPSTGASM